MNQGSPYRQPVKPEPCPLCKDLGFVTKYFPEFLDAKGEWREPYPDGYRYCKVRVRCQYFPEELTNDE